MRLRHLLRRHTAKQALTRGMTRAAPVFGHRRGRVAVLCYHSVHASKRTSSVSPDLFAQHLEWLAEHCEVVPLADIPTRARTARGDRPVVALTFDDGFRDNADTALPLLASHDMPATFFITSGLVDRDPEVLDRFAFLLRGPEEVNPMSWSQVLELDAAGMDVGDHTWRHSNLAAWPTHVAEAELRRSKEHLEDQLGHAVSSFAHPFGKARRHVTDQTDRLVRQLGYATAVAIRHEGVASRPDPLDLPRFTIHQDPVDRLAAKLAGPWDVVGWTQARSPLWLARAVSPDDFALEPDLA